VFFDKITGPERSRREPAAFAPFPILCHLSERSESKDLRLLFFQSPREAPTSRFRDLGGSAPASRQRQHRLLSLCPESQDVHTPPVIASGSQLIDARWIHLPFIRQAPAGDPPHGRGRRQTRSFGRTNRPFGRPERRPHGLPAPPPSTPSRHLPPSWSAPTELSS
jgi:hypothetical protein